MDLVIILSLVKELEVAPGLWLVSSVACYSLGGILDGLSEVSIVFKLVDERESKQHNVSNQY